MRLKKNKCIFMISAIQYLGHKITKDGVQLSESKVEAVTKAPSPRNVTGLKAFLGLINYYGKFLLNLSTTLAPLHKLLAKRAQWKWGNQQQQAFETVKTQLSSSKLLAHHNSEVQLVLCCDASPYGLGAVLTHRFEDERECPMLMCHGH